MRPALYLACALLLAVALHAQAPSSNNSGQNPNTQGSGAGQSSGTQDSLATAASAAQQQVVPLSEEPHHQIVLRNDFVHVYKVSVQPLDATLTHRHDLPYLAVSLGPADVDNLVAGKPEVRLALQDGQVIYSPGGFAHLVRTDAGTAFRNVTVEFAKPQGTARNMCKQIVAGPPACPQEASGARKTVAAAADDDIPYFETEEFRVDLIKVSGGRDYVDEKPQLNSLLVALTNAGLDVNLAGQHTAFVHEGDILWLPAGLSRRVMDFLGTRSNFLLISFKDSVNAAK